MDAEHFRQTYWEITRERDGLASRRTDLENELSETRKKIAHLDEILGHLAPLSGISDSANNLSQLGLTDAVRAVIHANNKRFSPIDVRQRLQENGYDLSDLTAPMAS